MRFAGISDGMAYGIEFVRARSVEWCRLNAPGFGKKSAMRILAVQTGVDALKTIAERTAP